MNRIIVIVLVSVLGAGLVVCAAHGDLWLDGDSATPISHGLGCSVPLMIAGLLATLSLLPLTARLAPQPSPEFLSRPPASFFQPPERSA